jgi:cobalt-zinc-cadmium efflux system outer membrane protein
LPVPDSIALDTTDIPRDTLLTLVRKNNPDLMAIRYAVDREKAGIKLANKSSYPNFSVGVDYIETGPALNPSLPESGKDPWMVSVGIALPIWFGKNDARKNEARARFSAARHKLAQSENDLTAYTDNVHYDFEDDLRKISLYRDGLLPKAQQSLNTTYASYEAGESDFLSVLDAQRQLLNFQLEYDHAYTNAAVRRAEMEMLAGQEFGPQE